MKQSNHMKWILFMFKVETGLVIQASLSYTVSEFQASQTQNKQQQQNNYVNLILNRLKLMSSFYKLGILDYSRKII